MTQQVEDLTLDELRRAARELLKEVHAVHVHGMLATLIGELLHRLKKTEAEPETDELVRVPGNVPSPHLLGVGVDGEQNPLEGLGKKDRTLLLWDGSNWLLMYIEEGDRVGFIVGGLIAGGPRCVTEQDWAIYGVERWWRLPEDGSSE